MVLCGGALKQPFAQGHRLRLKIVLLEHEYMAPADILVNATVLFRSFSGRPGEARGTLIEADGV